MDNTILQLYHLGKTAIVRRKWVYDSILYKRLLPVTYYSLDPIYMSMKGCKIITYMVPNQIQEYIKAWVELHGGKYDNSNGRNGKCTHLVTVAENWDGEKLRQEHGYQFITKSTIIVTTKWFESCVTSGYRTDETPYRLYMPPSSTTLFTKLKGEFLISNLQFNQTQQIAINQKLANHGGQVFVNQIQQSNAMKRNNGILFYICKNVNREEFQTIYDLYNGDYKHIKFITPDWISDCIERNQMINIYDQVLYRPVIQYTTINDEYGCRSMCISISKFYGDERDYVKAMVNVIGAKYTSELSDKNTHLICKYNRGKKYTAAKDTHIQIVSKHWLDKIILDKSIFNLTRQQTPDTTTITSILDANIPKTTETTTSLNHASVIVKEKSCTTI